MYKLQVGIKKINGRLSVTPRNSSDEKPNRNNKA